MRRAIPFLLFGAVALIATGPGLVGRKTLFDTTTIRAHRGQPAPPGWVERGDAAFLLPTLLSLYNDGLQRNELALWNPKLFCGYPMTSDPMLHAFYPPQILLHRMLPVHGAYHAFLFLHLFFAGASMAWLLRALGRSDGAVMAGGLLGQIFGYSAHWFSTGILAGTSVFGPLAILGLVRGRPLLAGAALGLAILGSHPQHALFVFLFALAWGLGVERRPRLALIAALAALLVGLPEIMARLESIEHGFRDPSRDSEILYGSGTILVQALLGVVLGPALPLRDGLLRSEFAAFGGLAAAALAVAAVARRRGDPRVRFLGVSGGLALALALLPGVPALLSQPSRWIHVFGFALAILAAEGWDALSERPGRAWAWAAGAALALLGLVLAVGRPFPLLLAAGFALACVTLRFPRPALGVAVVLLELLPGFLRINAWSERMVEPRNVSSPRIAGMPGPVAPTPWNLAVGGNLFAQRGYESLGGYEAIVPLEYVRWFVEAGGKVMGGGRVLVLDEFSSPKLDEAGLTLLDLPGGLDPGPGWIQLDNTVWKNPDAFPVVRLDPPLGSLRVLERSPGRLSVDLEIPAPGRLVVAENAYPGWRARIDGDAVELGREGPFQALALPAGRHSATLEYRPDALRIGFPISSLALLACLIGAILRVEALWKPRAAGRSDPSSSIPHPPTSPPATKE